MARGRFSEKKQVVSVKFPIGTARISIEQKEADRFIPTIKNYFSSNRMDTVLIHTATGLWPMLEYELDIVQRELDCGNRVIFMYCRGSVGVCPANPPRSGQARKQRYCLECQSRVKSGLKWLEPGDGRLEAVEYDQYTHTEEDSIQLLMDKLDRSDRSVATIKRMVNFEGVDVFEASYSTLMTHIRDSELNLEYHWNSLKQLLRVGISSYYSASSHIAYYAPDRVYIYNGRISRYRPLMRLVQRQEKELFVYEYPGRDYLHYSLTRGTYPHDIGNTSKQLQELFLKTVPDPVIVKNEAETWFLNRSQRKLDGPQKLFLDSKLVHMKDDHSLPVWDKSVFNLVFFVSSQDELGGIEENVTDLPFGQVEAIKRIMEEFPEIHCYVRIHPNLAGVEKGFVGNLFNLARFQGVTVIAPESPVSSYALVNAADLVLVFASTIGVEAAFQKKPVISVGKSSYGYFKCTATVRTDKDLMRLIHGAVNGDFSGFPSEAKRYEGACAFAWAQLHFGEKPEYLERDSYFGGYMVRNGEKKEIKASGWIQVINRLVDAPPKLVRGIKVFFSDPIKRKEFSAQPLSVIKKGVFSVLPS
ncbi:hypothetical protein FP507_02365 [Chlorobium phaeovibrioides]|uniref:Capsule polysaccharide biosynthesis protein n=1 Tax=Chlorobium phaeovibrioides TaxID=1094 RepID=A0A5M8ICB5_CHLPH|nr:hypothetical protein [Chlorobium phaeovibrioides]KAA6232072.1 hypothetical protein FP507_02365 [Chlorobium phaeovibrioides]